jgi:hypothetical protein
MLSLAILFDHPKQILFHSYFYFRPRCTHGCERAVPSHLGEGLNKSSRLRLSQREERKKGVWHFGISPELIPFT